MTKALAVYRKELRQISRDKRTLLILIFIPAFFLLLYGYALNFDIRHIRLAVQDRDGTPESRSIVSAFINSGYFDLAATIWAPEEADRLLNLNDVRAALVIPEGFGRDVRSGRTAPVQVLISGDNANTATTVIGYATSILRTAGAQFAPGGAELVPPVRVEPRIWYNPELRSTLFLVPGLIAYIAMITAVASTALSIVREKEIGTIEQVRMAPIDTFSFVVGKTIPYFLISLASAALIVLASMVLFGLPMRGSWIALLVALSLFLVGALATGLLSRRPPIRSRSRSSWPCSSRSCRPSCCRASSSRSAACRRPCSSSPTSCRRAISSSRCAASCSRARSSVTCSRNSAR